MLWYHNSDYDLVDVLHAALLVWLVALPEEGGRGDEAGRLQGLQVVAGRGDGEDLVQEQSWPSQADYIILFISPEAPIRSKLSSSFSVLTVFKVCT